jgi:hypothetical protein
MELLVSNRTIQSMNRFYNTNPFLLGVWLSRQTVGVDLTSFLKTGLCGYDYG